MPNQLSDHDLLARYLRGDIDARQEAELERRAAEDTDLRVAMEGIQSLPEHDHAASVAAMLGRVTAEVKTPKVAPMKAAPRRLPRYWWAAAAGLLLVVAALFLLPNAISEGASEVAMSEPELEENIPEPEVRSEAPPAESEVAQSVTVEVDPEPFRPAPRVTVAPPPPSPVPAAAPVLTDDVEEEIVLEKVVSEASPEADLMVMDAAENDAGAAAGAKKEASKAADRSVATELATRQRTRRQAANAATALRGEPRYLNGIVTDEDGLPISGAELKRPGQALSETTDSNGVFRLNFDATLTELNIIASGYEAEKIDLRLRENENLQITLEANTPPEPLDPFATGAVSTVDVEAITGGRLRKEQTNYAKPTQGYRGLRKSIYNDRPTDVPNGRVRINFLVNPDGTLSDFEFRGKPAPAAAEYVKNYLIDNGNWQLVRGDEPVRVYFKVRFR